MTSDKIAIYQELERRGEIQNLPPEKQAIWAELKRRQGQPDLRPADERMGLVPERQGTGLTDEIGGALETAATVGSAVVAEPIAGLAGIAGGMLPGEQGQGAALVQKVQDSLQYTPDSPEAMRNLQAAGDVLAPVAELLSKLQTGQAAAEMGAPPIISAILDTLPVAVAEIAGLKGAGKMMRGRKSLPGKADVDFENQPIRQKEMEVESGADVTTQRKERLRVEPTVDKEADIQQLAMDLNVDPDEIRSMTPDQLKTLQKDAEKGRLTEKIEGAGDAITDQGKVQAAEQLALEVKPDQDVVAAAEELGIDIRDVPANVLSDNPEFRALFGAVQSLPGSPLKESKMAMMRKLAENAEKIVTDAGGDVDTAARGLRLQKQFTENIKGQKAMENDLYDGVKASIRGDTRVSADRLVNALESRIAEIGGEKFLSPLEKRIWQKVNSKTKPTWSRIDDLRKELNAARAGKGDKDFSDADLGELKLYAGLVSDSQKAIAESKGFGDDFSRALKATGERKGVEKAANALFGKTLEKSLRKTFSGSVENLSKGDVIEFNKVMDAIPEAERGKLLMSEIADKFINPGAEDSFADAAKFQKWFNTLNKNKEARAALDAHLPADFKKKLNAMGKMSSVIKRAGEDAITTGRLNTIGEAFKTSDNVLNKLLHGGTDLAAKVGVWKVAPGFGGVAADALKAQPGTTAAKAADVFATPAFQRLTAEIATNGKPGTVKKAESVVKRSKQWQDYVATLPEETEAIIAQVGITNWLRAEREENNVNSQ